jgi:adenylylsulfate kinase
MTMEQKGFTVWFTGLSGSGKNTIARLVAEELRQRRLKVELLAGSELRQNISQGLSFTYEDRVANVRRIGYVAKLLSRNGVAVITTAVSPYRAARDECRREIDEFIEVFVDCPLEVCEQRDTTGLYARARMELLDGVAGVSDTYEPPLDPELTLRSAESPPEVLAEQVIEELERRGLLDLAETPRPSSDEELVKERLRALQQR